MLCTFVSMHVVMGVNAAADFDKKERGYNLSKNARLYPLYKDENRNYLLAFFSSATPMK
jgi:hypothetical protein